MKLQEQRQMLVNQSTETSERLGMTRLERRESLESLKLLLREHNLLTNVISILHQK